MKKLATTLVVLAMATAANAALKISVNGVIDPPDTEVFLMPSDWAVLDVWCDGGADSPAWIYWLQLAGPGSLDITQATNSYNPPGYPDSIFEFEELGIFLDLQTAIPEIPPLPLGTLINQIKLHGDAWGDVTLSLWYDTYTTGENMKLIDTQVIHIPEPMTLALLCFGGLFLRRRK